MPRSSGSAADHALVAHAARHGHRISVRQVERWREQGLIPKSERRWLGRGRGSTSTPAEGSPELVLWLAEHARPGNRPNNLALRAFGAGLAVPGQTVRGAFAAAIDRATLSIEGAEAGEATPDAVADRAVEATLSATLVPARIRRIDRALSTLGINWAAQELANLDPGFGAASQQITSADVTNAAIQMILGGRQGADLATMGSLARALAPSGAASPFAGNLEYYWPDYSSHEDVLVTPDGELAILPIGDMRDYFKSLARSAQLSELSAAWKMSTQLPIWAGNLCDAVEAEIRNGTPGQAVREWMFSTLGPSRALLITGLRGKKSQPADLASTALVLIFIKKMILELRKAMPNGHFELLSSELVPQFLADFWNGQ